MKRAFIHFSSLVLRNAGDDTTAWSKWTELRMVITIWCDMYHYYKFYKYATEIIMYMYLYTTLSLLGYSYFACNVHTYERIYTTQVFISTYT